MLVIPACAKVNLALEVEGRRSDGLHDIDSIVVPIDWHDLVGLRLRGSGVSLRLTGPHAAGVPESAANLAVRAAGLLTEVAQGPGGPAGWDIWVDKRVPAGSGLGGGSADAAAVLRAGSTLLERLGMRLDRDRLHQAAANLGSDVPALLARRPLRVTGHGERLQPIEARPLQLVVAFVAASSTAAAYSALQPDELGNDGRAGRLAAALATNVPLSDDLFGSALEPPALRVNAALADRALALRGIAPDARWHMTGSGGAYFSVAADAQAAAARVRLLHAAGVTARSCRTLAAPAGV